MYFIECFDGRFSTDRVVMPKTKARGWDWEPRLSLGEDADRGFPTADDPQLLDALEKMRTHPLMAGLRIRFKTDKAKVTKPKPPNDTVTDTFMEGTGDLKDFTENAKTK